MELIHPNWHVILIHYPLALLSLGILIELLSFLWRQSGFRSAGRWMILLGVLLALPAATAGVYAFRDVVGGSDELSWAERARLAPLSGEQWEFLLDHLWLNFAAIIVFLVATLAWIGSSDRWRRRLYWPVLLLLLVGLGLTTSAAWHGGEMVYAQGVAVAPMGSPAKAPVQQGEAAKANTLMERIIDPMQMHLILAGFTFALAGIALALSFRSVAEAQQPKLIVEEISEVTPQGESVLRQQRIESASEKQIADALGTEEVPPPPPVYPPGRWWLLATVVGAGTALAGLWLAEAWSWSEIEQSLRMHPRLLAHTVLGVSILVLSLILAGLTRWSRRGGLGLGLCALLLVLAVAGQVWMGVLLTFDNPDSDQSWYRFQPVSAVTAAPAAITPPVVTPVRPVASEPPAAPPAVTRPAAPAPPPPAATRPVAPLQAPVPATRPAPQTTRPAPPSTGAATPTTGPTTR